MDISTWRTRVLLEPRGFIRVLQFVLSIVAFATTTGFSGKVGYVLKCKGGSPQLMEFPVAYPFRIDEATQKFQTCDNETVVFQLYGDFSPSAQWFVSVGVLSFLLTLGSIIFYVAFESSYRMNYERYVTIGDFAITCLFAFFWLTAASAWAWGFGRIKYVTSSDYALSISPLAEECNGNSCRTQGTLQTSGLATSIAFGFLNCFLWACNIWFTYKESPFHPEPNKGTENISSQNAGPQNNI